MGRLWHFELAGRQGSLERPVQCECLSLAVQAFGRGHRMTGDEFLSHIQRCLSYVKKTAQLAATSV